jgi:hypothetical protein
MKIILDESVPQKLRLLIEGGPSRKGSFVRRSPKPVERCPDRMKQKS